MTEHIHFLSDVHCGSEKEETTVAVSVFPFQHLCWPTGTKHQPKQTDQAHPLGQQHTPNNIGPLAGQCVFPHPKKHPQKNTQE